MNNSQEVEKVVEELGRIREGDILGELAEHSARYGWFAVLYAKAKAKEERLKFELKVLEAELDREYRMMGGAKVTEKYLEKAVVGDRRYKEKMEEYLRAKEEAGVLQAIVDALEHKKDMLVSYVSMMKEEMKARSGVFEVEKNGREG